MKNYFISFTILLYAIGLMGQKYDNNWISGINYDPGLGTAYSISFSDLNKIYIDSIRIPIRMTSGQITLSNSDGQLIFYTNGNYIANRYHELMPNGEALNQGSDFNDRSVRGYMNYFPYGYTVIPDKEDPDIYYLIHPHTFYSKSEEYQYYSRSKWLKCTRINMRLDGGKGAVDDRERIIYRKETSDRYRIIQHGNGRDYWFLTKDNNGQYLHVLLFSGGEILQTKKIRLYDTVDYLQTAIDSNITNQGLLDVANSGEFFIDLKGASVKVIYDFNRCTGEVIYRNEFDTPIDTYVLPPPNEKIVKEFGRVLTAFSPSDRYYYCHSFAGFYQYDLEAADVSASAVQLFGPPIVLDKEQNPSEIGQVVKPFSILGPDGKIYALYRYNHYVINEPDQKGEKCRFDGPKSFGRNIYFDAPLYPNYRMGPLKGSFCDSLSTSSNDRYARSTFRVFPNPSNGPFTIELDLPEWDTEDVSISIYDAIGREYYRYRFPKWAYRHEVDPGGLPPGAYLVRLEIGGAVVHTERMVVF